MANDPVLYESLERIAIITLNRPEALNAMNDAMIEGLHQAWRRFNDSDDRVEGQAAFREKRKPRFTGR